MDTHAVRQRRFPAGVMVVVVFILCITPGQYYIAKWFPAIAGLARINPSLVFLDIPTPLPVGIDLVLVPGLFLLVYPIIAWFFPARTYIPFWQRPFQKLKAALAGMFALLCCVLAGGLLYYLVQDSLPRQVRNGINTYGLNADIHLAYPGFETINLRGSMVLLVCFFIGMMICIRKLTREPEGQLTREQRMTPYQRMLREKRLQKEGYNTGKTANVQQEIFVKQETSPSYYNTSPRACSNHPVVSLKPLAVNYMPM